MWILLPSLQLFILFFSDSLLQSLFLILCLTYIDSVNIEVDIFKLKMVFSYTPKSDKLSADHDLVVLVSVVNGLNPEDLLKTKVFFIFKINTLNLLRKLLVKETCRYF